MRYINQDYVEIKTIDRIRISDLSSVTVSGLNIREEVNSISPTAWMREEIAKRWLEVLANLQA